MANKTFFVQLKDTCRKIESDVNDIKAKMIESHEDHYKEEVISKKIRHIQDEIQALKTDANGLRNMLGPKLEHTSNFIKNLKELMTETEECISKKEEYLKQYGYTPVESVPQDLEPPVENNVTPDKKIKDMPVTPNLLDYGIPSYTLTSTPALKQKSSIESLGAPPDLIPTRKPVQSDSTPTLNVAAIISTSESNGTPPVPEPLYTPAKETPPFPEQLYSAAKETPTLPEPLYTSAKETCPLAYNSVNFPNTPKMNI